ncbi:MAG: SprT-like domain-containing protein [candidate division Zixibacteria bacterium]
MKKSASPTNFDIFDALLEKTKTELPEITDLEKMFEIYNRQYFGGKLLAIKIKYSTRMLAAGAYFSNLKEIRISEKYHQIFPDEVYDTLKHEMIHILYPKHDASFKRFAQQIGASIRATEHPDLRRKPKYLYICPRCHTEYPRTRRLRMASCGKCSKGRFDERFKLILKKNPIKVISD